MEGSAEDVGAPDSWEAADIDESMKKLLLKNPKNPLSSSPLESVEASKSVPAPASVLQSSSASSVGGESSWSVNEDCVNHVDQFLLEALQNPRERLSVLRIEQDVQKFIGDPNQEQLEFRQLPTSYLRLAAHRVAQHYSLQSMVLLDNSLLDGSGSRIIAHKTSDIRLPVIRLADIPINSSTEDSGAFKFAIKQRPQKHLHTVNNSTSHSIKSNSSKSVEERKEEYNKARAKIFSSVDSSIHVAGKSIIEPKMQHNFQHGSLGIMKVEGKPVSGGFDSRVDRDLVNSTTSASGSVHWIEEEPIGRYRPNNRVAIFRDREVERNDPDFDRNYDRYMQRFDPGFGFNGGAYVMQPMYSPAVNYNTEFPQLGSSHRPQMCSEPQHLSAPWAAPSSNMGIGYGQSGPGIGYAHPDTMVPSPFNPNLHTSRPTTSLYLHSPQYPPSQQPRMPFIYSSYVQSQSQNQQQQGEMEMGLGRPR